MCRIGGRLEGGRQSAEPTFEIPPLMFDAPNVGPLTGVADSVWWVLDWGGLPSPKA